MIEAQCGSRLRLLTPILAVCLLVTPRAWSEPALWHLSDADSDIYLLGTVHVLPPDVLWETPEIAAAFAASDTIWFEAPANDPSAALQMLALIQQLGLNPPDQPLSSQISASARDALGEFASRAGVPVTTLEPLRPWLAAITLSASYIQTEGYDPDSGVEARLWPLAIQRGKNLDYFETLEQQLRFFADLPHDVEVGLFEQTILGYSEESEDLNGLVRAWEGGDLAEIDRLVNGELRQDAPEIYEVVITQRNQEWVGKIQSLLAGSGSHFIALGAGHLAGADGVIELLRAGGIEVEGP